MNNDKYYKQKKGALAAELKDVKRKLNLVLMARLAFFFLSFFLAYLFWPYNWGIVILLFLIPFIPFVIFIKINGRLNRIRDLQMAKLEIIEAEIRAESNDYSYFFSGKEFNDSEHAYANDLDLFVPNGLFQRMERCFSNQGRKILADDLKVLNEKEDIKRKQEFYKELSNQEDFRLSYLSTGYLINNEILDEEEKLLQAFMDTPKLFSKGVLIFKWGIPALSVLAITLTSLGILTDSQLVIFVILSLVITGAYLKKINMQLALFEKIKPLFTEYKYLLKLVQNQTFESELGKEKKGEIIKHAAIEELQKGLYWMEMADNRNNLIIAILGNAFLAWDIHCAQELDNWRSKHSLDLSNWVEQIHEWEKDISYGAYVFNNPDHCFPAISNKVVVSGEDMAHPFLSKEEAVANSININKDGEFVIITGANMAGKSTFLRTIGLNWMLAWKGLPVRANKFEFTPMQLYTSMRTSDSVNKHESYFYSELKRLKQLVDKLQEEKVFVILDEILKGTNSKDKEEGSRKFVKKMLEMKASGIIATHDLSLTEIKKEHQEVTNMYFDAYIKEDDLYFDYKLKEGVCQNMNASFLMEKMNIT